MDLDNTSNTSEIDPDNIYIGLDSDFSLATDGASETSSIPIVNDNDNHQFFFNYDAFQKTRENVYMFRHENIDNEITTNDIDADTDSSFISSERNSDNFNIQEEDYIINDSLCEELVPCVVLDIYDGKVQRCPNYENPTHKLRPLRQLVGTWEIDESTIDKSNPSSMVHTLGVCTAHFSFDRNRLHSKLAKCDQTTKDRGHLFERKGSGVKSYTCHEQHANDSQNALTLLGQWLINIAESEDKELKQDILTKMALVLSETYQPVAKNNERNSTTTLIPSLLMIKTIMRLGKVKINKLKDDQHLEGLLISESQSKKLGEVFGRAIWNARSDIIKNKIVLESPESFDQYCSGFPDFLRNFFDNLVTFIQKKKYQIGTLAFTNQMLLEYKNIFYNLLKYNETEIDVDKVYKELVKDVEPGYCKMIARYNVINNLKSLLVTAFQHNSNTLEIFKNTTEYTDEGFNNLFTCYNLGIERLKIIHSQEITKEILYTTKGRKQKNQIKAEKHRKEIEKLTRSLQKKEPCITQSSNIANEELEKQEIFDRLIEYDKLPAEETSRILIEICTLPRFQARRLGFKKNSNHLA
ncbi:8196_t:CDS:2 [Gigaspora margarita]|uniref:8196_t:CDS:1 n=1 Tax=Gigaspora margarita TaxID=4874 RepID=A0ABN7UHN0_GIGMA|nr:8196_t:CDS:2 [Gigaspora margarita]